MPEDSPILVSDHRGEATAESVLALERTGYGIARADNLRQSIECIAAERPTLIVLWPLAQRGLAELEAIHRARAGRPPVPLLVVGGKQGSMPCLPTWGQEQGAWDVIAPEAGTEEWELRVNRLAALTSMLRERSDLQHRASHDDRTDLLRPAAFQTRLKEHFSAASRHGFELALLMLDLDGFGAVNKRHDHTVGDILITQVGEVIRRVLRTEDVAGRLGGDEFAIVLPYTRKVDAAAVANRICREIHKLSGRPAGAQSDIVISASLGFETSNGRDVTTVEELRLHAERALRESKVQGGDRGTYYRALRPGAEELEPLAAPLEEVLDDMEEVADEEQQGSAPPPSSTEPEASSEVPETRETRAARKRD